MAASSGPEAPDVGDLAQLRQVAGLAVPQVGQRVHHHVQRQPGLP